MQVPIRKGTRSRDYAEDMGDINLTGTWESIRRFNENTRNRALLLAPSKRLRRIYLWGSTLCLFVLSPLLLFAPSRLASHFGFGSSLWFLEPSVLRRNRSAALCLERLFHLGAFALVPLDRQGYQRRLRRRRIALECIPFVSLMGCSSVGLQQKLLPHGVTTVAQQFEAI